jgi:glycosyltransferase involved in cell wall biosynthesis
MIIGPFPPPFGGVAIITSRLAASALNRVFRVKTINICLSSEKTENTGDRPVNLRKVVRLIFRMLGSIAAERPQAVLLETSGDISCFREMIVALAFRLFTRARVVTHLHGRAKERVSWRSFPFMRDRMRRLPDRWALNLAFAFSHSVVFLSPVLKDQFRDGLSRRTRRKSTWVENFIEASTFSALRPQPEGSHTVLFMGRLSRAKGFPELVRAIPLVLARHPCTVFSCCGAPETEEDLRELRPLLDDYVQKGWLVLHGIVQDERKAGAFASADVMVYPSHFDMFPVTILEGLAQGLPIVTTPVGVIPAILKEGENALFTGLNDPALLAERLCYLLDRPRLMRAMGEANKRLAWERFDISVAVRRFHAILESRDPDLDPAPGTVPAAAARETPAGRTIH